MIKSSLKKNLQKLGLIDFARVIFNSTKTFSLSLIADELKFRNGVLPDGYSAPPAKLIFLIIGLRWASVYWTSGKEVFMNLDELLRKNKVDLDSSKNILDFGCGAGRIIRQFHSSYKNNAYFGCDYNDELIAWCREHLTFADFTTNNLLPPLNYSDNSFDLIYARSVFTHISLEAQILWMKEYNRVLKPGGYFYVTTHGENTLNNLNGEEKKEYNENGIVVINQIIEGDNKCTVFQSRKVFETKLLQGFEQVDFVPGIGSGNLRQDIYLLKKI